MPPLRCAVLKCKVFKNIFGTEKASTWQQRIIELDKRGLRWFATESADIAQNEIPIASIVSFAAYACTDNPWVRHPLQLRPPPLTILRL
jgi:hypothetical protein